MTAYELNKAKDIKDQAIVHSEINVALLFRAFTIKFISLIQEKQYLPATHRHSSWWQVLFSLDFMFLDASPSIKFIPEYLFGKYS